MPARIGRYEIQRRIGAGGMAVVYAALQESPSRVVALKVMRPGIAASATARRFRRESEILARLRHPHIAQIYDAGLWDDGGGGMPYFVMEFIPDAAALDAYCDAKRLDLRERLKLFVKVCAGVQHGHAQGIVHRDLKPGNVLVTAHGEPKIIDYGVARAMEPDFAGQTQQTEAGKLVGTVSYMSPEQVEARPGEIDPRTDVYSLGVILYRLLTDRSPYPLSGVRLHEAVRVIREDAPTRPSAIKPELRGDLETILLTCLDKDRTRRFADAGAFGRDLLRYLAHKPIKARPAGPLYRLRLFVRRNRGSVIAATMVVMALLLLGAGAGWMWFNWQSLRLERLRITEESLAREARDRAARLSAAAALESGPAIESIQTIIVGSHPVLTVTADRAGRRLAALDADGVLRLWSLPERESMYQSPALDGLAGPLIMMPAGDRVLLGRRDGLVEAVRVADGGFEQTPLDGGDAVTALAVSADGRGVASGGRDLLVRVWPTSEVSALRVRGLQGVASALALSHSGGTLAVAFEGGPLMLMQDSGAAREEGDQSPRPIRVAIAGDPISHLAFSVDGSLLLAATPTGALHAIGGPDRGSPELLWSIRAHERGLTAMALHPSGRHVVTADDGGRVRFRSIAGGGSVIHEIAHSLTGSDGTSTAPPIWTLCYAEGVLAIGDDSGRITLVAVDGEGAPQREAPRSD
jgi:hypothetical protein